MVSFVPRRRRDPAALVVALHGCGQNAAAYDYGAGWSALAERHGFVLLLPEQRTANNPNLCFNWFRPNDSRREAGEPQSIRQMVDWMIASYGLARSRVFITGLSAGAAMAGTMLAVYPELFAGGGLVAGLPYGCAGNLQEAFECMLRGRQRPAAMWGDFVRRAAPGYTGPWPRVSIWHGEADETVAPLNALELVKQWADVHRLDPAAGGHEIVDGSRRTFWHDGHRGVPLESYTVPGMGHGIPLGEADDDVGGIPGRFTFDVGISSTKRIASFWGLIEVPPEDLRLRPGRLATTARRRRKTANTRSPPRPATRSQ